MSIAHRAPDARRITVAREAVPRINVAQVLRHALADLEEVDPGRSMRLCGGNTRQPAARRHARVVPRRMAAAT
jgi:hypothetical protein